MAETFVLVFETNVGIVRDFLKGRPGDELEELKRLHTLFKPLYNLMSGNDQTYFKFYIWGNGTTLTFSIANDDNYKQSIPFVRDREELKEFIIRLVMTIGEWGSVKITNCWDFGKIGDIRKLMNTYTEGKRTQYARVVRTPVTTRTPGQGSGWNDSEYPQRLNTQNTRNSFSPSTVITGAGRSPPPKKQAAKTVAGASIPKRKPKEAPKHKPPKPKTAGKK
jgi:hypothetical protein